VQEATGWAMPAASRQHTENAAAAFQMDDRRITMTKEQQRDNDKARQATTGKMLAT